MIESVRLSRERDVVRDVRRLAHELVRLDDEAVDVSGDQTESEIQRRRGQRRYDEPTRSWRHDRAADRERSAKEQRNRHARRAEERDVRVGIGDAGKDRVVVEQALEAAEIRLHREHHEQDRPRDGEGPRAGAGPPDAAAAPHHLTGARCEAEEQRHRAADHRQRRQPSREQLPHRQREQIERNRAPEDGIGLGRARERRTTRVPPERKRRPVRHHPRAGDQRDDDRYRDGDGAQHGSDRHGDGAPVDEDDAAGAQLAERCGLQRQERAIEAGERRAGEHGEQRGLDVQRRPEHLGIPERSEPERLDVVGCGGAGPE